MRRFLLMLLTAAVPLLSGCQQAAVENPQTENTQIEEIQTEKPDFNDSVYIAMLCSAGKTVSAEFSKPKENESDLSQGGDGPDYQRCFKYPLCGESTIITDVASEDEYQEWLNTFDWTKQREHITEYPTYYTF